MLYAFGIMELTLCIINRDIRLVSDEKLL